MTFEIAKRILDANRGANFVKADLHIHTPGSIDWDEKNTDPNFQSQNVKPEHFVQAALNTGLGLIAVTDHNSVEWCEPIIQAAKGTTLVVLPGFELSVRPGVHILGLFNPKDNHIVDDMRDLLKKFGIEKENFGNANALTEKTIEDLEFPIIRAIEKKGGIAIPAHIQSSSGLLGRLKGGQAASDFLNKSGCRILETNRANIPEIIKTMLRDNPNQFGIIESTDAHQIQEIGCNHLWLKMDEAGLNGLRQISVEPLKRIKYSNIEDTPKTKILGLFTNGGLLKDQVISFNSELNCLIGGRGAGKSVVVDYLRFVFNSEPVDEDLRNRLLDRFADLIRDSTKVCVLIEDRENKLWLYERIMRFEKKKNGSKETIKLLSEPAVVYQIILDPPQAVRINDNLPNHKFEFYGQGEVQSITETTETSRQIKLIDDFIQTNLLPKNLQSEKLTEDLTIIEKQIIDLDAEIDMLDLKITGLPEIEARISEIEADLKINNLSSHQIWEDANQWLIEAYTHLLKQKINLDNISFTPFEVREYAIPSVETKSVFDDLLIKIQTALSLLISAEATLKKQFADLQQKIEDAKKEWEKSYNAEKESFTETLRKQGVENLAALNTELADKKRSKEILQQQDTPRLIAAREEKASSIKVRNKKLGELWGIWNSIRQARISAAERMTDKLGQSVVIEIQTALNLDEYYASLYKYTPSEIHSKNEQIQKVVENLNPQELTRVVRSKNIQEIRDKANITHKSAELLITINSQDLMQLERVRCDDIANIYLVLEGRKKPLNDLSQGERCTAILSVILLDEHCPLVIDQPEDELDHSFIMTSIVNTLGSVKQKSDPLDIGFLPKSGRQFIIATHNQNIPVLGDAELVMKMHKVIGEDRCEAESSHGLENAETIKQILSLEGGHEAFERRRRKYELSRIS